MKIGIIVHSTTGNTLSVAGGIEESLKAMGHTVSLLRVTAMNDNPNTQAGKQLKNAPDTDACEALIIGAPVWAFSLSSVMKEYLSQHPSFNGKKTGCFVTQSLPYAWMGGTRSVNQMKAMCESKDAAVFETGIIHWSSKKREEQIRKLINKMKRI